MRILLVRIPDPVRAQLGQYCLAVGQNPAFSSVPTIAAAEGAMAAADVVIVGGPVEPAELGSILPAAIPVFVLADLPVAHEAALVRGGVAAVCGADHLERLPVAIHRHVENAATLAHVRSTEAESRQVQDRFRELIEGVAGVVYEFDLATERFTYVSGRAESLLGYPVSDWLAPGFWRRMVHPDDGDAASSRRRSDAATDRDHTLEFRANTLDGRVVWIQDRIALNRALGGGEIIAGLLVDITRVKEAEFERTVLQTQLVQAQKMEAVGTLAGGIAHDFNNILMGILGNAEMALEELASWHPAVGNVTEVIRAANRARDAVQRILTFSRKQEPVRQTLALHTIVDEAVVLLRATLPSTIELVVQPLQDAPQVHVDPSQIHQVLMNLATNAAHAIGNRAGSIIIRETVVQVDRELAATCAQLTERTYLRLSVHDSGNGMDPVTLSRVFEPFFTTKAPGEGTGLGLAVAHGIIEEHDGAIIVESKVGQGTAFHLYFPALPRTALSPNGRPSVIPRGRGEHVLLVDDEAAIVRVGRRMLERLGYRVTAVESAREALTTFRADPAGFDLVISDLTMPEKTGLELAREIRTVTSRVKFLLTTGHPDAIDRGRPPEIDGVLSKPFATARLGQEVDRILRAPPVSTSVGPR